MKLIKLLILWMLILTNGSCTKAQQNEIQEKRLPVQTPSEAIVVGQKIKLYSRVLGEEKELYITLPPKYKERVHSYTVVFVLEAEYLFEVTSSIIKLIQERSKMPQSIVVGLANGTYQKRNEMTFATHGGKTKAYLQFLKDELIPYIEKNYRANTHRTIIGLSPTNGLLFDAFWSAPNLFKGYIALATHWEWHPEKNVSMVDKFIRTIANPNHPKTTIYMGTADEDMQYSQQSYEEAIKKLSQVTFQTNVNYQVDLLKREEHYLMAMSGIRNGFKLIYPDNEWGFPRLSDAKDPVAHLQQHYSKLSKKYGFDVYPVENGHNYGVNLAGLAYNFSRWKHKYTHQQLIDLLKLSLGYYPNSAHLHMTLAKAYKKTRQTKLATISAQRALKFAAQYQPDKLTYYKKISRNIIE